MDAAGVLDERLDEMDDIVRARHLPSMQLVGAPRTLDLNALQARGRLVGRFAGIRDGSPCSPGRCATSAPWPT